MRTTDKTSDKLLDDALDFSKVGNNDKNVKNISRMAKHTNDTLPALPIVQLDTLTVVNDKVKNVDIKIGSDMDLYKLTKE